MRADRKVPWSSKDRERFSSVVCVRLLRRFLLTTTKKQSNRWDLRDFDIGGIWEISKWVGFEEFQNRFEMVLKWVRKNELNRFGRFRSLETEMGDLGINQMGGTWSEFRNRF